MFFKTIIMKRCLRFLLVPVFLFFALIAFKAVAQNEPTNSLNGFYIGDGLLSTDQVIGISRGPMIRYMDLPYSMSGALFISYRKHISPYSVLGIAGGIDNQTGELSYGDPKTSRYSYFLPSGTYKRQAYTMAVEYCVVYWHSKFRHYYSAISAGYTFSSAKYSFFRRHSTSGVFLWAYRFGSIQPISGTLQALQLTCYFFWSKGSSEGSMFTGDWVALQRADPCRPDISCLGRLFLRCSYLPNPTSPLFSAGVQGPSCAVR